MLEIIKFIVPALVIFFIVLPLIKVFRGKTVSGKEAKRRLYSHIALFFLAVAGIFVFAPTAFADGGAVDAPVRSMADGLGFISAALAAGLSSLGAGIAVAASAPAAIGAISEKDENFGKALIFVALAEGVAIYGLLIAILILNKIA